MSARQQVGPDEPEKAQPPIKIDAGTSVVSDGVWGEMGQGAVQYTSLGWVGAAVLEIKVQIGLGVLALPSVLNTLGLVPGILVIGATAAMALWTQRQIGVIKTLHPEIFSLADIGQAMFGDVGREILGAFFWVFLTVIGGAAMIGISIALNALSTHGACTVIFVATAAIAAGVIASIQTLEKLAWLGWVGVGGILASVITLAAAVSTGRPALAPQSGPWDKHLVIIGYPTFVDAVNAVATVFLSFAGAPYYFNIIAELKRPQDYNRSILLSSGVTTSTYLIIGCVVYHYVGEYIASPALGSAGTLMKKVCYGLALPGLLVSCVLNLHIAAKYVFVRLLRNSRHLSQNTPLHWVFWLGCVSVNTIIAFVIAESIPVFDNIVSLAGAILGTPCAYTAPLMLWFYVKKDSIKRRTGGPILYISALLNGSLILISLFVAVAGLYTSAIAIRDSVASGTVGGVFSCADNSAST